MKDRTSDKIDYNYFGETVKIRITKRTRSIGKWKPDRYRNTNFTQKTSIEYKTGTKKIN